MRLAQLRLGRRLRQGFGQLLEPNAESFGVLLGSCGAAMQWRQALQWCCGDEGSEDVKQNRRFFHLKSLIS